MTRQTILTMDVDVTTFKKSLEQISQLLALKKGGYVCFANVHMCMEVFDSTDFRNVINQADMVFADGKPLVVAQKLLGNESAEQVRGPDMMDALCALSDREGISVGLYGGASDAVLDLVKQNLQTRFPSINITFLHSPPFRSLTKEEDLKIRTDIRESKLDLLFVGIGCPKQEIWMAAHTPDLNCVMLGVGAAFDYIAGIKKEAPKWIQKIGMEWLFRLGAEPGRLWKRYIRQNPRFIFHLIRQLMQKL